MIGLPRDRVPEWSPLSSELQTDTQQTQTRVINGDSFKPRKKAPQLSQHVINLHTVLSSWSVNDHSLRQSSFLLLMNCCRLSVIASVCQLIGKQKSTQPSTLCQTAE